MDENIQSILNQLIERVTGRFTPQKIILFGSQADGRAGPDSDIDLIIVLDTDVSTRQKAGEIDLLMADRVIPMDILVVTPKQYERGKKIKGTIVHQAEQQGKVIYERVA
jgi:predicted nucleotidyltransferase